MVVYGPDKSGCYQPLEGEKLNDYFHTLRIKEIMKSLENIEIKNFKNLIIFVTPSCLFPSCFNFKIVNNKIEEMKNIFKKEKERFEKEWNCKFDDIKNQYIPLHSILAGSKI